MRHCGNGCEVDWTTKAKSRRISTAARGEKTSKLILKILKDMVCPNLEHTLLDGQVVTTRLDKIFIIKSMSECLGDNNEMTTISFNHSLLALQFRAFFIVR